MRTKGQPENKSDLIVELFAEDSVPAVRGMLYRPSAATGAALVLGHGAGSNCHGPLLAGVASAFAKAGFNVLCCDLPFRQKRAHGPPFPGEAAENREGLRNAVKALRKLAPGDSRGRIFLGGHSYGGRQATMLAAEDGGVADGLLLLSYPLHPPRQPAQLRTAHFPALRTPALFVHGTRDPFGSLEEMKAALKLISGRTKFVAIEGAGHELVPGKKAQRSAEDAAGVFGRVLDAFRDFFSDEPRAN
ncbi:MAG TPA: alpha/beta fold hydrolase [Candidatus Acidoferrales bacterium]|nr:alpha/beta fold hydrolase [Candidatus Acidoferrales bacterium]